MLQVVLIMFALANYTLGTSESQKTKTREIYYVPGLLNDIVLADLSEHPAYLHWKHMRKRY